MKYKLNNKQEEKFEALVEEYKDKIYLAMYKTNINRSMYNYFYSFALEGLLQAFLIMEEKGIDKKDFSAFAFVNMKRKIIDELRKIARNRDAALDIEENFINLSYKEEAIENFILNASLEKILSKQEFRILNKANQGLNYKDIIKEEKISKSTYYLIIDKIRKEVSNLLYK